MVGRGREIRRLAAETCAEVITAQTLRQVYGVEVRVGPLDRTSLCLPVR